MKNLLVFSFCFLALVNCGDIKRENFVRSDGADSRKNAYTLEDYNLTENVDSVHTIKSRPILNSDFTTYQNDTTKMLTYSSFLKFDKKGRLTQGNYLSYDNFSLGKEEYIISENGKIIDIKFISPNNDYKHSLVQNTETRLATLDNYGDSLSSMIYSFYENDRLIKDSVVFSNGDLEVLKYAYDHRGLRVSKIDESSFNKRPITFLYKYLNFDEFGNWTKRIEYIEMFNPLPDSTYRCAIEERTIFYSK